MPNIRRLVFEVLTAAGTNDNEVLPDTGALTVICAPTGYDKTAHAKELWGNGARWLEANEGGAQQLWTQINRALSHEEDAAPQGESDAQAALALASALTSPITIIIDNYHLATNQETDLALATLAARPHINLIVIGRAVGLLDSPLISGRTNARVINVSHLAVNEQAMKQLPGAAALKKTEGWPLALRAALTRIQETPSNEKDASATANLEAFALDYLSTLRPLEQEVALAAAQLDAISAPLATVSIGANSDDVHRACRSLVELGVLVEIPGGLGVEYRCHEALRSTLRCHAVTGSAFERRQELYVARGKEVEATAPYTAFRLYCAAQDFAAAEAVLAPNFTTITDEGEVPYTLLRQLTEETLLAYPTLAGARVFLERQRLDVSVEAIEKVRDTWVRGLNARLPRGVYSKGVPLHVP